MKVLCVTCLTFLGISFGHAQLSPPVLFSEMNGIHFLEDGTALPIWGYGWTTDGFITLPGPLLHYQEGDDVVLAFHNPSPESHTIHLHGLDVDQANDGVPSTSFYVASGESTTYEFVATHPGTFLYHCHVTTTLHLTMGMYGMVLVTRSDGAIFENGPVVNQDVPLLFSDLEMATNLDPVGSFPFHDMRPDVFMVNGKSGSQLEEELIWTSPEAPTALRLASAAYSRIRCSFPSELNAQLWMSDGRAVPAEAIDSLDIYPGERFTVLIQPDEGYDGGFHAEFLHMIDDQLESTQWVQVKDNSLHPSNLISPQEPSVDWYPNPASDFIQTEVERNCKVWDSWGRLMFDGLIGADRLDVSTWPDGIYTSRAAGGKVSRFVVSH